MLIYRGAMIFDSNVFLLLMDFRPTCLSCKATHDRVKLIVEGVSTGYRVLGVSWSVDYFQPSIKIFTKQTVLPRPSCHLCATFIWFYSYKKNS